MATAPFTITVPVELVEEPNKGWVAHVPGINAVAQGESQEAAVENLRLLIDRYPEVIQEFMAAEIQRAAKQTRHPRLHTRTRGARLELELMPA